jgi:hypothetical protein
MNRPPTLDDSPDEPARDAWLSEALRHAPDADAAPSVAVRETILRQARAEAAASPTPPRPIGAWQRFNAAWSWLSGPRVAAAFASVMVATVIGLMWWDRPIDEALHPVEPQATVAAPAPAPTPAREPPAAAPAAPSAEPSRDLAAAAAPPRVALERKREAKQRGASPADPSNDARREAATAPAAQATAAAPRAADEARAPADTNDTAPDNARADKATKEIDAARERRAETAQAKAAAPALRSAPAAAAGSMYAPAPAAAPAPAPPPVAAAESRPSRAAPLAALLEALAEESPRWRWQRDGTSERALTPELRAWLQRLDRAVAGRWSSADPAQAQAQVLELRLLRDGAVQTIVKLGADGRVRIDIAGEPPLTAQLPSASVATLRRALDDATR